ncbi:glycoside hydrolase family 15 protein [Marmoricola sp. RAF53]|uniref:glycoside hydrolase family 15 protein n=1 Tax=Marmoricola sp. RAF53 TaxID=3233059 RepID=UPI003F98330E
MPLPIEDYAAVGDRHTVALVGRDGSVDWLCLPRYDSAACFSALLGDEDGSRWLLGPDPDLAGEVTTRRRYLGSSTVLETTYTTADGEVRVTDVMPAGDRRADLVRRIEGVRGAVPFRHEYVIRFDYGEIRPWVHREERDDGQVIVAVAGPDKVVLAGPRLPRRGRGRHEDAFTVSAGERLDFTLTWIPSHRDVPDPLPVDERLASTLAQHQAWADEYEESGPYADAVVRSLVTLRGLTHEDTGGIVAAATTSLPEDFGGERNWDYRYSWLRDAALAVEAMTGSSRPDRAATWRDWLLRAVAGDPEDLQIMYTVDGGRHLPEVELTHLAGYAGSRPVRIGNGAVDQRQTDVVGEVMAALASARDAGLSETTESWSLQRSLMTGLAGTWDLPDHGIWEIRGPLQHFTHSRIMVWVAFDRAVRAVEAHGLPGPVEEWRALREQVRAEILEQGVSPVTGGFRQHYGTEEADASLLLASAVGFVAGDDPVMLATIAAVERDLMPDGLVLRYRTATGVDGLAGAENPFLACSFWLVEAYALAGRRADAHALMERLLALRNDVGLLSEEYDVARGRMAGNFPQALSHLALVQAARALAAADDGQPVQRLRG